MRWRSDCSVLGALAVACFVFGCGTLPPVAPRYLREGEFVVLADPPPQGSDFLPFELNEPLAALSEDELVEVWRHFRLRGAPPPVDFRRNVVLAFATGSTCFHLFLTGLHLRTDRTLTPTVESRLQDSCLVGPGYPTARIWVLAVSRDALPAGRVDFRVRDRVRMDLEPVGAGDSRTRGDERLPPDERRAASRCRLAYPCPVIPLSELEAVGVRLPDGSHAWVRREADDSVSVFAAEQSASFVGVDHPGFRFVVYPVSDGFHTRPPSDTAGWRGADLDLSFDDHGVWRSGDRRVMNLARYAFERIGPDRIRLVARIEGSWSLPARIARPRDLELAVVGGSRPCPSCDENLWADLPKVEYSELARRGGPLLVEGAALLYGEGKAARLCPVAERDCDGPTVLDASPDLAKLPETIWRGPVALRRCGPGVCDVVLLHPSGGEIYRTEPVHLQAGVGAGALLVGGDWLAGGEARVGYRRWLATGDDPVVGDIVGIDLRLRALSPVTSTSQGPWLSASLRPWIATRADYLFGQQAIRQPSLIGLLVPEVGFVWRGAGASGLGLGWSAPVGVWLSAMYCIEHNASMACGRRQRPYHLGEHVMLEIAPEFDLLVPFSGENIEPGFALSTSVVAW